MCLAGEAGLRVGEVKALRWREDVDLVAGTITVNQQVRRRCFGTPKGRTRRTIPMTERLQQALTSLLCVREGLILRRDDGETLTDSHVATVLNRICRLAGLPERGWHVLRHTFASAHRTPIPPAVLAAGAGENDPFRRIVKQLGARGAGVSSLRSVNVAETAKGSPRRSGASLGYVVRGAGVEPDSVTDEKLRCDRPLHASPVGDDPIDLWPAFRLLTS
jgi:hypothetical protein